MTVFTCNQWLWKISVFEHSHHCSGRCLGAVRMLLKMDEVCVQHEYYADSTKRRDET